MGQQTIIFYERMVQTMNGNFNLPRLTETQKNALFAFGEKTKAGTGCNLMIAASMCEGDLTKEILMNLADLVETVGITDEEMEQLLYQVRTETTENIMNMEKDYEGWTGKKSGALPWRDFARKKILAAFGHDDCGTTIRRLCYVEHVTVDPDLKQIVHDLTSQIATMNVFRPEKYPDFLAEARKVDELWRIKTDDLGYFTVKD